MEGVRGLITDCLRSTSLRVIAEDLALPIRSGKLLRTRMILRLGGAAGVPLDDLKRAGAAVEMLHAASLLHDDVIDGALLRRGVPAFWVEKGASGAVLLGDLLVCQALKVVSGVDSGRLVPALIEYANEMCEAETEQELLLKGATPEWKACLSIARRKTGSLFAFGGYAAGGRDAALCAALSEAGYTIGTAYQLSDDLFDATGDEGEAGKSLGHDAEAGKVTAASACKHSGVDPRACIEDLCEGSNESLTPWPAVAAAWADYVALDFKPVISAFVRSFVTGSEEGTGAQRHRGVK